MKVAVPLFGSVVAPRFGFATEFLVAEILDGEVSRTERVAIHTLEWHGRLAELQGRGITVLLCGGFNRWFDPLAESLGIEVIAGLTGEADAIVAAYARGEEMPVTSRCRFRRRDEFGRGRGGAQGRGRGRCRRDERT
jgi:predicted Fe-Mo cluster-binding NifX family protein